MSFFKSNAPSFVAVVCLKRSIVTLSLGPTAIGRYIPQSKELKIIGYDTARKTSFPSLAPPSLPPFPTFATCVLRFVSYHNNTAAFMVQRTALVRSARRCLCCLR